MNLEVFREQDTVWIRDTDTMDEWPLPADVWGALPPILAPHLLTAVEVVLLDQRNLICLHDDGDPALPDNCDANLDANLTELAYCYRELTGWDVRSHI